MTTNKVSDALGLMWRRNLLVRYPAPRETSSLARYAYIWDKGKDISKLTPVPSPSSSKAALTSSSKMTEEYIKQRKTDEVMPHGRKK